MSVVKATVAFARANPITIAVVGGSLLVGAWFAFRDPSSAGTSIIHSSASTSQTINDKGVVFRAFWEVVGREESYCDYSHWTGNDANSGVSVGWIQFNQRSGLTYLLQRAYQTDQAAFVQAFSPYHPQFSDTQWVKSAPLNQAPYKRLLSDFLISEFGQRMQVETAYYSYFQDAQNWVNQYQPNASDEYRVLVGSAAVQTSPRLWKSWVRQAPTFESFSDVWEDWLRSRGLKEIADHRIPRQKQNIPLALSGQFKCR